MFTIPDFYQNDDLSFQEAWDIMTRYGRGDCLEGMKALNRMWTEYWARASRDDSPDQDDDWLFYNWQYEFNAYNIVYAGMSELFAPKEVA